MAKPKHTFQIGTIARRLISCTASKAEKLAILEEVLKLQLTPDRVIEGILSAMQDEDPAVRKKSVSVIISLLANARNGDEEHRLMQHIMQYMFGPMYDPDSIAHHELFRTLKQIVAQKLSLKNDNLFAWMMQEANRVQQIHYSNTRLPEDIARFFDSTYQSQNSRSKEIFEEISEAQYFLAFTNPKITRDSRLAAFQRLHRKKLTEVPFHLIVAHLHTILHQSIESNELRTAALTNLERWSGEFPTSVEQLNEQRKALHRWRNEGGELPDLLEKQLGINVLVTQPLVKVLLNRQASPANKGQLFRILANFHATRWHIEEIGRYILQQKSGNNKNPFPFLDAINFLGVQLTNLDEFQPPAETIDEDQITRYERRHLTRRNLHPDALIREVLLTLTNAEKYPLSIRQSAWRVYISSHPKELLSVLREQETVLLAEESTLHHVLESISHIYFLPALGWLRHLWQQKRRFRFSSPVIEQLIRTIGTLGSREILGTFTKQAGGSSLQPGFLLAAAIDTHPSDFRNLARLTLEAAGYEAEILREEYKSNILQLHEQEKEVSDQINKLEKQLNQLADTIRSKQLRAKQIRLEIRPLMLQLDILVYQTRAETTMLSLELIPFKKQLDALLQKLGTLNQSATNLSNQLTNKEQQSNQIMQAVKQVTGDLQTLESRLQHAEEQRRSTENILLELEQQIRRLEDQRQTRSISNEEANRQTAQVRSEMQNHTQNIQSLNIIIPQLYKETGEQKQRLTALQNQMNKTYLEHRKNQEEADQTHEETNTLQQKTQAIQYNIDQIEYRMSHMAANTQVKTTKQQQLIDEQNETLQQILSSLQQDSHAFNQAEQQIAQLRTRKQELGQLITSSREHFDTLADRCRQESFAADKRARHRSEQVALSKEVEDKEKLYVGINFRRAEGRYRNDYEREINRLMEKI